MKLSISLLSFWDSPYKFDYLGISDYANTICVWHDGRIECVDAKSDKEVEPDGKNWDFLFDFLSRVSEYEPTKVITSGGADAYQWDIEL